MKIIAHQRKRTRHRSVEPISKMIPATGTAARNPENIRSFAVFPEYQIVREKCALDYCGRCGGVDVIELRAGSGLFDPSVVVYVRRCFCSAVPR